MRSRRESCPVCVGRSNCSSLLAAGGRRKTISATRGHYASALAYSIDLAQFQLDSTVVINEPGVSKIVMKELSDAWVVPSSSQSELGSEISL
jgi:hypothetical protein